MTINNVLDHYSREASYERIEQFAKLKLPLVHTSLLFGIHITVYEERVPWLRRIESLWYIYIFVVVTNWSSVYMRGYFV